MPPGKPGSPIPPIGGGLVTYDADVCPGWLLQQPCVAEANDAAAVPEGEIGNYYPDGEATILIARRIARQTQNLAQYHRMKTRDTKTAK